MPLQVADLSAKLGLDTSVFDRGIAGIPGKFGPVGIAALGAVGAVAGIGIAAVKMGEEFDAAYDSIRIGTGATGARLQGLNASFRDVVTDVPASFGDASAAITGLNQRLGVTGPSLIKLSDQFLNLSRITGTDVADNVRLGTRLFGDWSVKTKDQAATMDQLFRATQKSGIGLSDLMATVVQFGAPLRNMGFSFSDSVAMLAKWEKEGVNTSTVLTGMKFALKTFAAAGLEPQAALAGITAKIHDATNAQTAMTLGMKTFGLRAGPDMVAAIREGRFQYQDFAKVIANGKDTINTAAKDTEDMAESWTIFANTLKVKAEPALSGIFQGLTNLMQHPFSRITDLFDASADEKSITRLEGSLKHLRAEAALRMALGDFTGAAKIQAGINLIEGKLGILRDHFITPMAVGHVKNQIWIDGINQGVTREQYFRDIMLHPVAVGHVQNALWLSGINQGLTRAQYFKDFVKNPMVAGHLNVTPWTDPIAKAMKAYNAWKSVAQQGFSTGRLNVVPPASGYGGGGGPAAFGQRADIVQAAESRVGDPYVWGGSSPGGFDCSGLMYWAYQHSGDHDFPRIPTYGGRQISRGNIQPADIMFYYPGSVQNGVRVPFGHFKMYAGNNQTVESTSGGVQVRPADWAGVAQIRSYLARGGITTGPSIVGEAGPEAVIPLTNARRGAAVMREAGLLPGGEGATVIHEHYYIQLPGGSAIVGNAEDVGRQIAPAVGRRHAAEAAARARSR